MGLCNYCTPTESMSAPISASMTRHISRPGKRHTHTRTHIHEHTHTDRTCKITRARSSVASSSLLLVAASVYFLQPPIIARTRSAIQHSVQNPYFCVCTVVHTFTEQHVLNQHKVGRARVAATINGRHCGGERAGAWRYLTS